MYPPESKFLRNGYVGPGGTLPADMMPCPECGSIAYCESVDVGVGLYIDGEYECRCGWCSGGDGMMRVAAYDDYFIEYDNAA